MRLLHTADWHLGKVLCGASLVDDQAHALEQLVHIASDFRPSAILISGDIYDRVVPPPEAVSLLDNILSMLVREVKVKVIFIDGFQDSPDRLSFAARLLENQGVHARTTLTGSVAVELMDEHGPVRVYPVPCADLPTLRNFLNRPDLIHPSEATRALVQKVRAAHPEGVRSVVVAHTPCMGGQPSPSEPPIPPHSWVQPALFEGFDLAALGYFHKPQSVGSKNVQYSGSLLPYSFDEAGQTRSVNKITLDVRGRLKVEPAPINPRRLLRRLEGKLEDLIATSFDIPQGDYLQIRLTDEVPVADAWGRLRAIFPNLLSVEHPRMKASLPLELQRPDDPAFFSEFHREVTGQAPSLTDLVLLGETSATTATNTLSEADSP